MARDGCPPHATHVGSASAGRLLLPALLLGGLWFARDAFTYGATDWLGLARHNAVVVGQPRTLELYPNYFVAATYYVPIMFRLSKAIATRTPDIRPLGGCMRLDTFAGCDKPSTQRKETGNEDRCHGW